MEKSRHGYWLFLQHALMYPFWAHSSNLFFKKFNLFRYEALASKQVGDEAFQFLFYGSFCSLWGLVCGGVGVGG